MNDNFYEDGYENEEENYNEFEKFDFEEDLDDFIEENFSDVYEAISTSRSHFENLLQDMLEFSPKSQKKSRDREHVISSLRIAIKDHKKLIAYTERFYSYTKDLLDGKLKIRAFQTITIRYETLLNNIKDKFNSMKIQVLNFIGDKRKSIEKQLGRIVHLIFANLKRVWGFGLKIIQSLLTVKEFWIGGEASVGGIIAGATANIQIGFEPTLAKFKSVSEPEKAEATP